MRLGDTISPHHRWGVLISTSEVPGSREDMSVGASPIPARKTASPDGFLSSRPVSSSHPARWANFSPHGIWLLRQTRTPFQFARRRNLLLYRPSWRRLSSLTIDQMAPFQDQFRESILPDERIFHRIEYDFIAIRRSMRFHEPIVWHVFRTAFALWRYVLLEWERMGVLILFSPDHPSLAHMSFLGTSRGVILFLLSETPSKKTAVRHIFRVNSHALSRVSSATSFGFGVVYFQNKMS